MAPRRGGGGLHISGGGSGGGSGGSCSNCDTPMGSLFFHLYSSANVYGQLIVNAIFAALLIGVFFLNRKPAAKLVHLATFCLFSACVFQCVRFGLIIPDNWIPHGYRFESSIVVLMQRMGVPVVFAALIRAMRPGMILSAGPWLGLGVLSALNLAYVIYDFLLSAKAVEDWVSTHAIWRMGDRDFALLWSKSMVGRWTDQPQYVKYTTNWSLDFAIVNRVYPLYDPSEPNVVHDRGVQIKIGLAADVVALLLVLGIGGMHLISWHKQGKAAVPRRRSFLALAVGGMLLSTVFRVVVDARYILPNWRIITNERLWSNWLAYFPDTNNLNDMVPMPSQWIRGYRRTVESLPILQVIFEQIGPVFACGWVVLSMAGERKRARETVKTVQEEDVAAMKMQGQYK